MTKRKDITTSQPVQPQKWQATRQRERIEPKTIPHINSTMRALYRGTELSYRGRPA